MKDGDVKGTWEIKKAITTVEQCGPIIREFIRIETSRDTHPSVKRQVGIGDTTGVIIISGSDKEGNPWSYTTDFKCLPDSIDPRK